jgi:hypothetical protein
VLVVEDGLDESCSKEPLARGSLACRRFLAGPGVQCAGANRVGLDHRARLGPQTVTTPAFNANAGRRALGLDSRSTL